MDTLRDLAVRAALARLDVEVPCPPPGIQPEQVRLLFLSHLHRDASRGIRAASGEVRAALAGAFPCPQPAPRPPTAPGERHSRERGGALAAGLRNPHPRLLHDALARR